MTRLLVPIDLAVLVERASGEVYADTAQRAADRTVSKPTRQRIQPAPFTDRGTRPTGVHLHWAVPDALARYDGQLNRFPRLPCRWVVIRSSGRPAAGTRRVRAWLLADIHRTPVPVVELPATVPATSGTADLDITGPDKADPSWFAYYDNTLNRLSFHDDLADAPDGPLSYLVCGWYVRTRNDPLHTDDVPLSEAALRQRLATLGWGIRGPVHDLPTDTLYHGSAVAIGWPAVGWPGDGGGALLPERDARPGPSALAAGLGDRTAAVLGELLTDDDPAAAALIELLAGGEIRDLNQVNGVQVASRNAHRDRFVAANPPGNSGEIVFTRRALAEPGPAAPPRTAAAGPAAAGDTGPAQPDAGRPRRGGLLDADASARRGFVAPLAPDPFPRATTSGPATMPVAPGPGRADLADPSVDPGELERVVRPDPRTYLPVDPQIVLSGAGRTYRHGEDGRFGVLGRLPCRVTGETVALLGQPAQTDGAGRDLLPRRPAPDDRLDLPTSALDPAGDIEALLVEVHALDPAMNPADPGDPAIDPLAQLRVNWLAAHARRSMPGADPGGPPPDARTDGIPPAPLALTLPGRPWHPLHLDWTLGWTPSARGVHDWVLDDLDFEPAGDAGAEPGAAATRAITGKAVLTATPSRTLADALAATLAGLARQPGGDEVIDGLVAAFGAADATDLLFRFAHADLVGAQLDGYLDRLRGTPEGTWISRDGIVGSASLRRAAERAERYAAEPLVAGVYTPGRLRLVDTFGRVLDLAAGAPPVTISHSLRHPGDPSVALQRPRLTAPSTIEFRYVSPFATGDLSRADVGPGQTPLTALLTPNPFDGSLEVHDADGASLGQLSIGPDGRARWEAPPGTAAVVGAPPAQTIGDRNPAQRNLAAVVDGILRADESRDGGDPNASALATLLRAIDVARYTVDPTAKAGDQHLQALLGSPVAVLRARVRMSLDDPQADPDRAVSVPVRLGSVGDLHDGLLCFYLTEQPDRLHLIHPALTAADPLPVDTGGRPAGTGPLTDRDADTNGVTWTEMGRDLDLLLIVTPGADVGLTSGLAPGKVLETQREWLEQPMSRLTPTLRFDAVLRDPVAARIPAATDVHGRWDWHHRTAPAQWRTDPVQQPAEGQLDPARPAVAQDGYLRVTLLPDQPYTGIPFQVVGIRRIGPARTIQRIRVVSPTGRVTDLSIDEAIQMASSGRFAFFTEVSGFPRVDVIVDSTPRGRKFLRTNADQTTGNNLSALPTF